MKKLDILIYTIIFVIVVGFITFYFVLQKVCGDDFIQHCAPPLPIPAYEYLPNITDTPLTSPDAPTGVPTTLMAPTSTAGQSATPTIVVAPTNIPTRIDTPASATILKRD